MNGSNNKLLLITILFSTVVSACSNQTPMPKKPNESKRYAINKSIPPEIKEVTVVREIYE